MDCSPPGSSVHWISQARILEWVAISYSRGSSQPRDQICIFWVLELASILFTAAPLGKPNYLGSKEGIYRVGFSTHELHRYRNQGVEAGVTLLTIIPLHTVAETVLILTTSGKQDGGMGVEGETGLEKGRSSSQAGVRNPKYREPRHGIIFLSPSLPFEKCLSYTEWAIN